MKAGSLCVRAPFPRGASRPADPRDRMPRCRFDSAPALLTLLLMGMCAGADPRGAADSSGRFHQLTHGQCTYTFILPEAGGAAGGSCRDASSARDANSVQRDAQPPDAHLPSQKLQQLESIMENYTQWLHKVRRGGEVPLWGSSEAPEGPTLKGRLVYRRTFTPSKYLNLIKVI